MAITKSDFLTAMTVAKFLQVRARKHTAKA